MVSKHLQWIEPFTRYHPPMHNNLNVTESARTDIQYLLAICTKSTLYQIPSNSHNYMNYPIPSIPIATDHFFSIADDWNSIFGDPTKFGLGLFSILFDLLFMFQHYILFRNAPDPDKGSDGYRKIGVTSYHEDDEKKSEVNDGDKGSTASLSDEERPLLLSNPKKKGNIKKLLGAFKFNKK